jgi:AraC-like DNA-binding protein
MAQADGIDPAKLAHGDVPGASPSRLGSRARGALGRELLDHLEDYIVAHLDEPIEVAALARIAGRSPFHFIRVFARSVGMTPHRYVVHLRLQHAIELVRNGQSSLAQIAVRTGFADQSHLSRWVRRVYGVSLTQLVACTALPPGAASAGTRGADGHVTARTTHQSVCLARRRTAGMFMIGCSPLPNWGAREPVACTLKPEKHR